MSGDWPTLHVFIAASDPYSYLLIQALPELQQRFKIRLRFFVLQYLPGDMFPEPEMLHRYALTDAANLADLYGFQRPNPEAYADAKRCKALSDCLLELQWAPDFLSQAANLYQKFNNPGDTLDHCSDSLHAEAKASLFRNNESQISRLGHYGSSMIHFEGEWYWGLDRLDHLEQRLLESGLHLDPEDSVRFNKTYLPYCYGSKAQVAIPKTVKLFWSARSPYSYLALSRTIELAKHYGANLEIKPVLPMVMRGLPVPKDKKMYIFLDTKREAEKLKINYGKVADPLGKAVENCYALCEWAKTQDKLEAFLISFANAVNAEGIDAGTHSGLKKIVNRAGLSWNDAQVHLKDDSWRVWADQNLKEMYGHGSWGVPTMVCDDTVAWGQDRLWLIEKALGSSDAN